MGTRVIAVGFAIAGLAYAGGLITFDPRRGAAAERATARPRSTPPRAVQAALVPTAAPAAAPLAGSPAAPELSPMAPDAPLDPVQVTLDLRGTGPVEAVLRVTNTGRKLTELRFGDGQTHEVTLRDGAGRVVWRFSEGRMFTQAMRTRALDAGETVEFAERLPEGLADGAYTVQAELRREGRAVVLVKGLTVP